MTVTYTSQVATSSVGCFLKLLFRWRGSLYKLLWREFVIFVASYFALSFTYRFVLDEQRKRMFEVVARYCEAYNNLIPVAFVLGFYIAIVVERWNLQFNSVPWPDRLALFVTASVKGADDRGRLMRRTIMRYVCLSYVITMSSISGPVKKRFPTFTHISEAGFLLAGEEQILMGIKTPHNKYFIPLVWATSLVTRARKEGRIRDDFAVKTIIDEINQYRGMLGNLFSYDMLSVPLVYTQVVTLAVYMFFLSCLMGRQFLQKGHVGDVYVPVFTILQFFFYMGWLKKFVFESGHTPGIQIVSFTCAVLMNIIEVAETLMNPFGEDDDDFEINAMIDRNLQVSYLIVDEMHADHPQLIKDQYWDSIEFDLPYTPNTEQYRLPPRIGSAHSSIHSTKTSGDYKVTRMPAFDEQKKDTTSRRFISEVSVNTYSAGDKNRGVFTKPDLSQNTEHFHVHGTKPDCPVGYLSDGTVNAKHHNYLDFSDVDSDDEVQIAHNRNHRSLRYLAATPVQPSTNNWHGEGGATVNGCPVNDAPDWTVQPCKLSPDNKAYMVTVADYSDHYGGDRIAVSPRTDEVSRTSTCSFSPTQRLHRSVSFQHDSFKPPHM